MEPIYKGKEHTVGIITGMITPLTYTVANKLNDSDDLYISTNV